MILSLANVSKKDIALAGGKGASLGEMAKAGFPIPIGFIISPDSFNAKSIIAADEATILNAYDELGASRVAVRSSALVEDAATASWAGQLETFLNVQREDLLRNILKCWQSGSSQRVQSYVKEKSLKESAVAVVVQVMVDSDISGVIFTANPTSNNPDELIIEACFGLGEMLMQGEITPKRLIVDKNSGKIKSHSLHSQDKMLIYQNGNKVTPLPKERAGKGILNDNLVQVLVELGKKVEKHYGVPQDIEWAIASDKVFILQARPITTLKSSMTRTDLRGKVLLKGIAGSQGIAQGTATVVKTISQISRVKEGDILVAHSTTPDYVEVFGKVKGIVTDIGGVTSHAAVVARELGIPAVVGTEKATQILKDGQAITISGFDGLVFEGLVEVETKKRATASVEPIKSSGNEIDDLVDVMAASIVDARDIWPLEPVQLFGYVDLDQSLDMYQKLKQLRDEGKSFKEIGLLFRRPVMVRYFLLNSGVIGLKAAHNLKIGAITIKEQVELVKWMIEAMRSLVQKDPLCLEGKNLFWNKQQTRDFLSSNDWQVIDEDLRKAINLLTVNLFSLNWSFYWDYFGAGGFELHGPYEAKQFGDRAQLVIRDYFNFQPTEIWPVAKEVPFKSIMLAQIYDGADVFINFGNRIVNKNDISRLHTHFVLLVDGKTITDVVKITKLAQRAAALAKKQTEFVNSLEPIAQVRKGSMLAYYTHKDFYLHFSKEWYPKKTIENAINTLGDKFVKMKSAKDRPAELRRQMFDPRNYILP